MFPLTDLSILFMSLLIIAVLCIGLLALLGLCICKRHQENEHPQKQPTNMNQPLSPQPPQKDGSQTEEIRRELRFGTTLAIEGIGLAITIYGVNTFVSNILSGLSGILLGIITFILGYFSGRDDVRQWIRAHRQHAFTLMLVIVCLVLTPAILSVFFHWKA